MSTESPLGQTVGALHVLPIQISVISEIAIGMVIESKTLRLLIGTLIVGVVGIVVGVGIGPALIEVLAIKSSWQGTTISLTVAAAC